MQFLRTISDISSLKEAPVANFPEIDFFIFLRSAPYHGGKQMRRKKEVVNRLPRPASTVTTQAVRRPFASFRAMLKILD